MPWGGGGDDWGGWAVQPCSNFHVVVLSPGDTVRLIRKNPRSGWSYICIVCTLSIEEEKIVVFVEVNILGWEISNITWKYLRAELYSLVSSSTA
jgi:hypothetical protein